MREYRGHKFEDHDLPDTDLKGVWVNLVKCSICSIMWWESMMVVWTYWYSRSEQEQWSVLRKP